MLLNASLIGYFTEIGAENKIIGVSSPEYIFSDKIHQFIKDGKIQNIGNEQKYDVEKILAYKPDVISVSYTHLDVYKRQVLSLPLMFITELVCSQKKHWQLLFCILFQEFSW